MDKVYVGIDLGNKGGIAVVDMNGKIIKATSMPLFNEKMDTLAMIEILKELYEKYELEIVFERLAPIFGTAKKTTFEMGKQSGLMEGICYSLGIRFYTVSAKVWQEYMFKGTPTIYKKGSPKKDTKAMSIETVRRIFPQMNLNITSKGNTSKVYHDGISDALLMAEYIRKTDVGNRT